MRAIITGGTGLIGSQLAASLAKDGYEVIVLSRNPGQHQGDIHESVQAVRWDAHSADGWGHLADGADIIVNLAGANLSGGRWTEARKRVLRQSRLDAGHAIVEAVEQAAQKPKVLIQPSGVNYYGMHGDETLTEQDPPGDDFLARLTIDWEASTAPVEQMGVRRVVTRSGVVLSLEGGAFPKMALPFHLFAGGPVGSGKQWLSWIHIADEVAAMRFLIDNPQTFGVYNLTAPNPVTNRQFGETLGRVLHKPSVMPVPAFVMQAIFGEMSSVLLEGQRVLPERLEQAGFQFKFPTLESALQNLYHE